MTRTRHQLSTKSRIGLAVLLVLAAGTACFPVGPPAPTQFCGTSSSSAAGYQSGFHGLTHAGTGWITADGFVPVQNSDGTTAWWMDDTMTGSLSGESVSGVPGYAHNSLVVQGGGCLTPRFGGSPGQRTDVVARQGQQWFWPSSTFTDGGIMYVFGWTVVPGSGPAGFDWATTGTAVARFAMPSLGYLGLTQVSVTSSDHDVPWGVRVFEGSDGYVYLYGTTKVKDSTAFLGIRASAYVARAQISNLGTDHGAWEFWTGPFTKWLPGTAGDLTKQPMQFGDTTESPAAQLSVVPYEGGYLAASLDADLLGNRVLAWTSDGPQGPWQRVGAVAAYTPQSLGQYAYDGRMAKLPGAGWTVIYNVNDPNNNTTNVDLYGGRFATPAIPITAPPPTTTTTEPPTSVP